MVLEEIEIREARKEDFEDIVRLWKKLTDYHHKLNSKRYLSGKEREEKIRQSLEKFFAKKRRNRKFLVAVKKGKPIAIMLGSIRKSPSYLYEKRFGEIDVAFVEEKFRRKGIGRNLFEELLKWFKKRKIKLIEVLVDSKNEIGISAYKNYGFSEVSKRMALEES
ncbi:MAG: GNAT family N-acetyltransferase [Candidatus Aenigmatarchaeota archaeon]